MVRLKVIARIIHDEVNVKDAESSTQSPANLSLSDEKKLIEMVDEPENISIGILANQIKARFQRINRE
jgi:hypothetical protein